MIYFELYQIIRKQKKKQKKNSPGRVLLGKMDCTIALLNINLHPVFYVEIYTDLKREAIY